LGEALDPSLFTVSGLAHRCRQETALFYQQLEYDERYCFELFRRAIKHKNEQAWDLVIQQYTRQVASWIRRHALYSVVDESIDYFVNKAFFNFWRAFSRDVHKLGKFNSLKAILRYLQLCAHTALKEYAERRMNPGLKVNPRYLDWETDESANPARKVEGHIRAEHVWQHVLGRVKTEQERIIVEAYLIYDMKPRKIYEAHADIFANVEQVRRTKDNMLGRLRRDKHLLELLQADS
jgi:hypothetical protein